MFFSIYIQAGARDGENPTVPSTPLSPLAFGAPPVLGGHHICGAGFVVDYLVLQHRKHNWDKMGGGGHWIRGQRRVSFLQQQPQTFKFINNRLNALPLGLVPTTSNSCEALKTPRTILCVCLHFSSTVLIWCLSFRVLIGEMLHLAEWIKNKEKGSWNKTNKKRVAFFFFFSFFFYSRGE